ncbi:uncharacterized protein B0I36DRAFT_323990 [Microdochium trichocladiopsis]|uniref:Uncharacterized protein n=1 Tax=Microdochium trichocladiopsis TaxID=1682393 RepID=A0A9P8Y712_9PEZI|nr:uncharacterized protein B0I36DRAFT_323990 [Microdochium trichocladiopsis]KAH7031481.1 hypothetical protein B0I36DRAFT_323990 [Microdochium trichocladiopsis]
MPSVHAFRSRSSLRVVVHIIIMPQPLTDSLLAASPSILIIKKHHLAVPAHLATRLRVAFVSETQPATLRRLSALKKIIRQAAETHVPFCLHSSSRHSSRSTQTPNALTAHRSLICSPATTSRSRPESCRLAKRASPPESCLPCCHPGLPQPPARACRSIQRSVRSEPASCILLRNTAA